MKNAIAFALGFFCCGVQPALAEKPCQNFRPVWELREESAQRTWLRTRPFERMTIEVERRADGYQSASIAITGGAVCRARDWAYKSMTVQCSPHPDLDVFLLVQRDLDVVLSVCSARQP